MNGGLPQGLMTRRPHRLAAMRSMIVARRDDPRLRWIWLAMVLVIYTLAYLGHPALPGNNPQHPDGWWGWWDQGQYLKSAKAIGQWSLGADTYWYPLGYPAMAAAFVQYAPRHAFFVVNAALVLVSANLLWTIARRYMSALEALALGIAFIVTHQWLLVASLVVPWNTLPVQTGLYASIYCLFALPGTRAALWISAIAACLVWIRPVDVPPLVPLLAAALWGLPTMRRRVRVSIACAVIVAIAWLANAALKFTIFSTLLTPYDKVALDVGFGMWPMLTKLYWMLVDGSVAFDTGEPGLLFIYPWLPLGAVALAWLAATERLRGAAVAGASIIGFATYLEFNAWSPDNVYKFLLIHYVTWLFPLLFVYVYAMFRNGGKRWAGGAAAVVAMTFLVAFGVQMKAGPSAELAGRDGHVVIGAARPLMLEWNRNDAPLRTLEIRDSSGPLSRFHDYQAATIHDKFRVLLSPAIAADEIIITSPVPTPPALKARQLEWHFGFDAPHAWHLLPARWFVDIARPVRSAMDATGPRGEPDGEPDVEIRIDGPEALLRSITGWKVHIANDEGRRTAEGDWSSDRTQRAWWIVVDRAPAAGTRLLFVKDNGKALNARNILVEGTGSNGEVILHMLAGR